MENFFEKIYENFMSGQLFRVANPGGISYNNM